MVCVFCEKEGIREVFTDYTRNFKDKKVIVKNVPALYCETCGDYYFKNSVIKEIRNFINNKTDKTVEYIMLFDYNDILVVSVGA